MSADWDKVANKPTIGEGVLTLTRDGVSKGTFNANATSNTTINIDTTPDYLLFKIPNLDSTANETCDLNIIFGSNDNFTAQSSILFTNLYNSGRFSIGAAAGSTSGKFISTSTMGAGIPATYANDTLRYDLSTFKSNSTISGYNNVKYQWIITNGSTTVSSDIEFGMINGSLMTFGNEIQKLHNKVNALEETISNTNAGFTAYWPTSNTTMASFGWYLCLTSGASTLTLPTTNIVDGDMIKITVSKTAIQGAGGALAISGTVYGETDSGWGQISNLQIDVPQTITLIYQETGSKWNLVEMNIL